MTVYVLDHYRFMCAHVLLTAACIRHHPSRSSESHRNSRLCPSRWSPRQSTHRSPRPVMVWSSRSTVYRRGEPSSRFRRWPRIRYAFTLIVSPSCPTLIVPFMRYWHTVWCWGWDGAGDLDGPDVDPIWERMPSKSTNSSAVSIRHNRMWL